MGFLLHIASIAFIMIYFHLSWWWVFPVAVVTFFAWLIIFSVIGVSLYGKNKNK